MAEYSPLVYKRFIDDIFLITKNNLDIESFKNNFEYLKLNIVNDKTVQFLDLEISIDEILNKLNFSLYIKKTNTFSYLNVKSNHPTHFFKNIPKSLFLRIRRICTKYTDYLYFCTTIYVHLIQIGYNANNMIRLIQTIGNTDRHKLLEYKPKSSRNSCNNQEYNLKLIYNSKFDLKSLLIKSLNKCIYETEFPKINLKPFYSINCNIRDILIHGKKFTSCNNYITKACVNIRCKICAFINSLKSIRFKNGLELPLLSSADCNAKNCIYLLHCLICDAYYIGQTNNFKQRFPNHTSTIRNYCYNKCECEIARHYNQADHLNLYINNLKWFIFVKNIVNVKLRLSTEQEIIRLFKDCGEKIMNEKIYNKSIKSFLTGLNLL